MARARKQHKPEKLEMNMSAMIDVVFQLLIFFMLTLKIIEPEGDFNINMPASGQPSQNSEMQLPDIKVKLRADSDGNRRLVELHACPIGHAGYYRYLHHWCGCRRYRRGCSR